MLHDFISGEAISNPTPEDYSVQALARWLVAIGYPRSHIQTRPQYRIKHPRSHTGNPVDLAVFTGPTRADEDLLIIAEVKKAHVHDGLDQLHKYLRHSGAQLGIWFNGTDLAYLVNVPNAVRAMGEAETDPTAGFGSFLRETRENLKEGDAKFSVRGVASRTGVEPSYLSKIERGIERPSDNVLIKLAAELGVSEDVMFGKAGRLSPNLHALITLHPVKAGTLFGLLREKMAEGIDPDVVLKRLLQALQKSKPVKDGKW